MIALAPVRPSRSGSGNHLAEAQGAEQLVAAALQQIEQVGRVRQQVRTDGAAESEHPRTASAREQVGVPVSVCAAHGAAGAHLSVQHPTRVPEHVSQARRLFRVSLGRVE